MYDLITCLLLIPIYSISAARVDSGVRTGHLISRESNTPVTTDTELRVIHEASRSLCHAEGRAFQCMPPFTNVAEGTTVIATSTCGQKDKTEEFCRYRIDQSGRSHSDCEQCNPPEKFDAKHLTDRHQMTNETLWVSGPVKSGEIVNLTLSLGKRFEVYYISLQPHGRLPDSIALYKSADFGKTWQPWQYFSTDCYRAFRLPTSNEHTAQISAANIQEVLCVALKSPDVHETFGQSAKVIAFSTTIGRPSSQPWSSALIDWMTMTDLRISLSLFSDNTHLTSHDAGGLLLTPNLFTPASVFRVGETDAMQMSTGTLGMSRNQYQSDAASLQVPLGDSPVYFAFSDLAIGGRCKCNGHANRCVRDRVTNPKTGTVDGWGPLRCDCQHNTAGTDCERCASGYLDRPWARATSESANECKLCQCGNHTTECVFSVKLFKQNGNQNGGMCVACRHNTDGPNCDRCITGYTRNKQVDMGHELACQECSCHPIGSIPNKPCDRNTGQCPCKPGVTGQACNRCQQGYKQTRLSEQPCIRKAEHYAYRRKVDEPAPVNEPVQSQQPQTDPDCPPCKPNKKRIRFKKFCRREAVFRGTIESQKVEGDKIRYEVRVQDTWRVDGAASRLLPKKASTSLPAYPVWAKIRENLITNRDGRQLRCFCPDMKLGKSYLFLTQSYQVPNGNRMELMLDEQSVVIPWREAWRRRLTKFARRAARGRCESMDENKTGDATTRLRRVQRLRTVPGYYSTYVNPSVYPNMRTHNQHTYQRSYGIPAPLPPSRSAPGGIIQPPTGGMRTVRMQSSAIQNDHGIGSDSGRIQPRTQHDQPNFTYYHPYMGYYNAKH